ncbi:MAG: hypothetical protein U5K79_09700 [Cyclobacteriaceae bacterium]|nr:hypothetical protein [Cyclobacteriaceae bacterium]
MNKFVTFLLPIFLLLGGCETTKDLLDVNFDTTLTKTIPVVVTSTDEMTTFVVLDATTDPEIMKYANKIKSYEITDLKFAIENYNTSITSEIYFNGVVGFSDISAGTLEKSCPLSPVNITLFAGTGDFAVQPCTNLANDLAELLAAENALKIYLKGTFSQAPLTFNLLVTVKVKIIANPL